MSTYIEIIPLNIVSLKYISLLVANLSDISHMYLKTYAIVGLQTFPSLWQDHERRCVAYSEN